MQFVRPLAAALALGALVALGSAALHAQQPAAPHARFRVNARAAEVRAATLHAPLSLGKSTSRVTRPMWVGDEVLSGRPEAFRGLASVEKPGHPVFDPSSNAWYASANGTLVRIDENGRLPVVVDDVQGIDVDVRASAGVAVSREPDDRIVLHRLTPSAQKTVLLQGPGFFYPRFSPDGSSILVSEGRPSGAYLWLVTQDGQKVDLGQGYAPSWHPDGRTIVFSRMHDDGMVIQASDLWLMDTRSRAEWLVAQTPLIEVEPTFSPDGSMIVFADAPTMNLYVAAAPKRGR